MFQYKYESNEWSLFDENLNTRRISEVISYNDTYFASSETSGYGMLFQRSVDMDLWNKVELENYQSYIIDIDVSAKGELYICSRDVLAKYDITQQTIDTLKVSGEREDFKKIICIDGDGIYLSAVKSESDTYSILYRLAENENNWSNVWMSSGSFFNEITAITSNKKNELFFSFYNYTMDGNTAHIYSTKDQGNTWTQSNQMLFPTLDFKVNGDLIIAAKHDGVQFSEDLGNTWQNVLIGSSNDYFQSVEIVPDYGVFIGSRGGQIYLNKGDNITWTSVNNFTLNVLDIRAVESLDGIIFAGGETNKIFKSSDNGLTWYSLFPQNGFERLFELLEIDGRLIAATAEKGIYFSDDLGETWEQTIVSSVFSPLTDVINGVVLLNTPKFVPSKR